VRESGEELVKRRLKALREHLWNSWRIYAGAEPAPEWLETGVIGCGCGGRNRAERKAALKAFTEQPIRQGSLESPWKGLVGGMVLGEREYARRLLSGREVNEQEQTPARRLRGRVEWGELVRVAEKLRGAPWASWAERHGDWGRDGLMHVAVRYGGLRLVEVMRHTGMKYQAAAQAVKRFAEALEQDPDRKDFVARLKRQMSII
jgi:hypothetical protein